MTADYPQAAFGEQVTALRAERGLTLSEVAEGTGKSLSYVSRMVSGTHRQRRPALDFLEAVARTLDVEPERFPEYREGRLVAAIRSDAELRDELFTSVRERL